MTYKRKLAKSFLATLNITFMFLMFFMLGYIFGGHTNIHTTYGVSMSPAVDNSTVVFCNERYADLSVGDIASYEHPEYGYGVMHRVNWSNGTHYRFKGDNNSYADPWRVTRDAVDCKAVYMFDLPFNTPEVSIRES